MRITSNGFRLEYDEDSDSAYIYFVDPSGAGDVATTVSIDRRDVDNDMIDLDEEGRILGIEVLDASRLLPKELLALVK